MRERLDERLELAVLLRELGRPRLHAALQPDVQRADLFGPRAKAASAALRSATPRDTLRTCGSPSRSTDARRQARREHAPVLPPALELEVPRRGARAQLLDDPPADLRVGLEAEAHRRRPENLLPAPARQLLEARVDAPAETVFRPCDEDGVGARLEEQLEAIPALSDLRVDPLVHHVDEVEAQEVAEYEGVDPGSRVEGPSGEDVPGTGPRDDHRAPHREEEAVQEEDHGEERRRGARCSSPQPPEVARRQERDDRQRGGESDRSDLEVIDDDEGVRVHDEEGACDRSDEPPALATSVEPQEPTQRPVTPRTRSEFCARIETTLAPGTSRRSVMQKPAATETLQKSHAAIPW